MALAGLLKRATATLLPLAVMGAVLVLPASTGAANPGPVQIPLKNHGAEGCPDGTFVAVSPGPQQSPWFVLRQPAPSGCTQGIDVYSNPGPTGTPQGQAVALPLTTTNCSQGTALFDTELSLIAPGSLGSGPPVGTGGVAGADPCPSGDAALGALQAALANVPDDQGATGLVRSPVAGVQTAVVVGPPGEQIFTDRYGRVTSIAGAWWYDPAGTPRGGFGEISPGGLPIIYELAPSGTAGVATLAELCPFC